MKVFESAEVLPVEEASVGLLMVMSTQTLILKTQYYHADGRAMCYVVATGERFMDDGEYCYEVIVKKDDELRLWS